MEIFVQFIKLFLSIILAAIIGVERKQAGKPVGMRTLSLVSAGSCLMAIVALKYFPDDSGRLLAGVVTGIGFLGAGAIIGQGDSVKGLTTAASIWAMAIVGLTIGLGEYFLSFLFVSLVYIILEKGKLGDEIKKSIRPSRK